jgi:hypothetical protein
MPSGNPFAPLIDVGGQVGPVSGGANIGVGGVTVGDHHAAAGFVLLGLAILVILYKRNFRFSTTIG